MRQPSRIVDPGLSGGYSIFVPVDDTRHFMSSECFRLGLVSFSAGFHDWTVSSRTRLPVVTGEKVIAQEFGGCKSMISVSSTRAVDLRA